MSLRKRMGPQTSPLPLHPSGVPSDVARVVGAGRTRTFEARCILQSQIKNGLGGGVGVVVCFLQVACYH